MGSFFRKADTEKTDTYTHESGEWIRVRASLTKAEANDILRRAPTQERDLGAGLAFLEGFLGVVLVGWSFEDEEGNPVAPSIENFRLMEAAGARWIEDRASEHLNKVLGREVEVTEGESNA